MLKKSLATWDMKSAKDIRAIYTQYVNTPSFEQDLMDVLLDRELQSGSTWILKNHLCNKGSFTPLYSKTILDHLELFDQWESQLHILQSFEHLTITAAQKFTVENFIRLCLRSERKLIRAWGYHGFHFFSKKFPEYKTEAETIMQKALFDEAASVKARIRNLLRESPPQKKSTKLEKI
ncbi:hypothetical protein WH96_16110 [Kiloniella spongiae]|uniref:DNA alkylation repair protein n=1 Tax=Kiloniella spongiae TaxID=1489064 RepID=A0A0H2MSS4_9PROT|nr:hypothetical protein [Kiloniella spongiae]KLN59695.1 hypothetical protein WH96_16110 [Kiloniella spongiae]